MKQARDLNWRHFAFFLALTSIAFLIHGYHPWSEDAETYIPGIEKLIHPILFPVDTEFFQLHAHMTWFPQLIAGSVRLLHIPLSMAILFWQFASFFLFLVACWQLLSHLFPGFQARLSGILLITALFTMPVAGTALYLMDPFLNPRNLIAFAQVLAVLKTLKRKYAQCALFLAIAISIHPFMSVFACSFCLLLFLFDRWPAATSTGSPLRVEDAVEVAGMAAPIPAAASGNPFAPLLSPPTEAYEKVIATRPVQFLVRWAWYEMLGATAPLLLLYWFAAIGKSRGWRSLHVLCRAVVVYGCIYLIAGIVISIPRRLEVLSLLQPMRSLYLVYIVMILVGGGLLGEYLLQRRAWRWIALFFPLCCGVAYAQRELYPQSQHLELPGIASSNKWVQAFLWIRQNTPEDAIFAIDPTYMHQNDEQGFRAIAQRSQLADAGKDAGVVEMFPAIGQRWLEESSAQQGIDHFTPEQFQSLKKQYRVSWVVLHAHSPASLECPYRNDAVKVCRLP